MARIDYKSFVGKKYVGGYDYVVTAYNGKDDKGKHFYEVKFIKTNNVQLEPFNKVREGKCIDLKLRKLNKAKKIKFDIIQRNKLVKQSKDSYDFTKIKNKRVLALDLSTNSTGIAFSVGGEIKNSATIIPGKNDDFRVRSHEIIDKIVSSIKKLKVEAVVIEGVYLGLNSKVLECLCELRGMLSYHCIDLNVEMVIVPTNSWKNFHMLTPNRDISKEESKNKFELMTGRPATSDDESDAYLLLVFALEG